MRALAVAIMIASTILAGCISEENQTDGDANLLANSLALPEGAVLEETSDALVAIFDDVERPFTALFEVPAGATMIRYVATPHEGSISVAMKNEDTGRRRCNQQSVLDLGASVQGTRTCGSLAAIDAPGTIWNVTSTGSGLMDARIEFIHAPVDGVAALLDLTQLSHATYELNPTRGEYVTTHDGTSLWVEVTIPKGEGPWPTVLAASPYNGQGGRISEAEGSSGGTPAMWTYWTQDWASRGYAAVNIDVRGFGKSGGCVEIWGTNEQLDQKFMVEWAAQQAWSDGHVGFYGQSYVATTPVAAAVHQAEGLDAIIAVAPVINSYNDWHYGGVPNGESTGSPAAYQALTDMAGANALEENLMATDVFGILQYASQGICDATIVPEANDPRSIYNAFYQERDFSLGAADITAAVMFTQGFEDANVKSAMIPGWFNEIESKKLGIFGHWLHQHPARLDIEVLMLGWMDEHVKGRDLGFSKFPNALISAGEGLHRTSDAWPPTVEGPRLYADFTKDSIGESGEGTQDLAFHPVAIPGLSDPVTLTALLTHDLAVTAPKFHSGGYTDGGNAFVEARLYEDRADGTSRLLTWGYQNLALRNGYETYEPLTAGEGAYVEFSVPFRPTEHVVKAGSTLRLVLDGVQEIERGIGAATLGHTGPSAMVMEGAITYLSFPHVDTASYEPIPRTALP